MDYELAKELKDAGFPFREWGFGPMTTPMFIFNDSAQRYACPILKELIEACGSMFVLHSPSSLDVNEEYYQHPATVWTAYSQKRRTIYGTGLTPDEAVARLWLATKQKVV